MDDLSIQRVFSTAGAMLLVLGVLGTAAARGEEVLLPDAEANKHWHLSASVGQAVFVPSREGEEPSLVIKREAARHGTVVLQVVSDAKTCVIESGRALPMEVPLQPDQTTVIALDGVAEMPIVKVNDRELAAVRGRWIGLVLKSTEPELRVRFAGGSYANVTFGPPREAVAAPPVAPGEVGRPLATALPATAPGVSGPATPSAVPKMMPPAEAGTQEPRATGPGLATPDTQPQAWPAEDSSRRSPVPGDSSPITEAPDLWRFSFSAAVEVPSAYFYRGLGREDNHLVIQPLVDTTLRVFDASPSTSESKVLDYVDLDFGFRSSHDWGGVWGGGVPYTQKWQEFDWHGGVTFGLLDRWSLGVQYENIESTHYQFRDVHQVNFRIGFDDRDPDYSWSLRPYALVSVEFEDQSDGGYISQANSSSGTFHRGDYLELGVAPQFKLFELSPRSPVTLDVPAKVGLSLDDYYEDHLGRDSTFGYFETGLDLGVPIAAFPAEGNRRFQWKLTLGFHLLFLGDAAHDLSIVNGTGSRRVVPIFTGGVRLDF